MTHSRPTLYDILGVSPDADAATIKAAWRSSADRFDPAEGGSQFRLFNEAAEVLLDPGKRAAYDAKLAADRPRGDAGSAPHAPDSQEPGAASAPVPVVATPAAEPTEPTESTETVAGAERPGWRSRLRRRKAGAGAIAVGPAAAPRGTADADDDHTAPLHAGPPRLLVAIVAVLAVLATVGAVLVTLDTREAEATERARRVAPSAATEAAERVLSYNHESIAADRDAGVKYFTESYREDYVETMDSVIADGAAQVEAVVEADVLRTAVVRAEPGAAEVLLYVNQVTTSNANDGEPTTALNRVRFSMVDRDGTWLVDDIQSY